MKLCYLNGVLPASGFIKIPNSVKIKNVNKMSKNDLYSITVGCFDIIVT